MGLELLIYIYLAILIVILAHELGHQPKTIKIVKWFPIPIAGAMNAKSRYGGLTVNAALFIAVWYFKPESIFLQLIGLVAWLHFLIYLIIGSFNYEPKLTSYTAQNYIWDDVDNKHWKYAIIIAIISFFAFRTYYIPILIDLVKNII